MTTDARHAADIAARASYGRLVAILSARSHDIADAEDALSAAFLAALRTWPETGVPTAPEAWLLTSARNAMKNDLRHRAVIDAAMSDIAILQGGDPAPITDPRLKLLFVCAHPAIDAAARTPLMLQTVLGLDAGTIARAFATSPATMGQRLVRAKARIRDTGLRFDVPDAADMPARLPEVLDAVYAAFGTGWDDLAGDHGLGEEAIFLAQLLVDLLPAEPEPKGLLALMLYADARKAARRDAEGDFVPLREQDHRLWSRDRIIAAEGLLTAAARMGVFGRYQCEAAIQSVHVQRAITGRSNRDALLALYRMLAAQTPGLGVLVAQAATHLDAGDAEGALRILDDIPAAAAQNYQPYWVTRTHTLAGLGLDADAAATMALDLTTDEAVRRYLSRAFARLRANARPQAGS
jgi:RNA polymerase sigma-70 factor, ECF subfamily